MYLLYALFMFGIALFMFGIALFMFGIVLTAVRVCNYSNLGTVLLNVEFLNAYFVNSYTRSYRSSQQIRFNPGLVACQAIFA